MLVVCSVTPGGKCCDRTEQDTARTCLETRNIPGTFVSQPRGEASEDEVFEVMVSTLSLLDCFISNPLLPSFVLYNFSVYLDHKTERQESDLKFSRD